MTTTVDLLLPELAAHDATSVHSLAIRDLLVDMGASVRIITERPTLLDEDVSLLRSWGGDADLTILQHAIGSATAETVIKRRRPVVVNYHNITPFEFIEPWAPDEISGLRWGRVQLFQLAPLAIRGIADSAFNAIELASVGVEDVVVAPVLWGGTVGLRSVRAESVVGESPTVLFVGRVAPNKCHEDLISAFAVLVRWWPDARLVLVGASSSVAYLEALEGLAVRLGVEGSVVFAGSVSDEELAGWYSEADVFVCVSEHEGFCVPLVEAMAWGVPVVAFGAAAVPETVGDAGVVLGVKDPVVVASAVDRVLSDVGLRESLIARGRVRAEGFDLSVTREVMREALAPVLPTTP